MFITVDKPMPGVAALANPRYPRTSVIKQMVLNAYYGR